MNEYRYYVKRLQALPLHLVIQKLIEKMCLRIKAYCRRQVDKKGGTYAKTIMLCNGGLYSYFSNVPVKVSKYADTIMALTSQYLVHRFDLLGSGWVQVKHGMSCQGIEGYRYEMSTPVHGDKEGYWLKKRINRSNLAESQRIWRLVDDDYIPIDWHLDFKSGYRWSENTWYLDVPYAHKPGVDIKVPWELARMQHLPQLAWAYTLAIDKQPGLLQPQTYAREFRNQVLDFIATNPPRFGVNWHCTMDVGIRIANWLVAYDIFKSKGVNFDTEFELTFERSVYEHGLHIINNLEWSGQFTTNHYLSNIVGLLFVAAYLPCTAETNTWLAFAIQELINEVKRQFYPDGSNYEASTSYHCLSAELVTYATALILGLPKEKTDVLKDYDYRKLCFRPRLKPAPITLYPLPSSGQLTPFPIWYIERLEKMAEFTMHITKPNNQIVQIGDNDSGRFLKLMPIYRKMTTAEVKECYLNLADYDGLSDGDDYWLEDHLDHRHLVAAINGFFSRNDFTVFVGEQSFETDVIKHLAKGVCLPSYRKLGEPTAAEQVCIGVADDWRSIQADIDLLFQGQQHFFEILSPGYNMRDGIKMYSYPDFGLYLYRSAYLYLAIRCGSIGQNGNGGHAHNDQLSIEVNIGGKDVIRDPGTYIYTPLPERRNQFRATSSHFTPQVPGKEQSQWLPGSKGLFRLNDSMKGECMYFSLSGFIGRHFGFGYPVYRVLLVKSDKVEIHDFGNTGQYEKINLYSDGYGRWLKEESGY